MQNIQINGSVLLDGMVENKQDSIEFGTISTGTEKNRIIQETEKLSKGEKTTEVTYQKPQQETKAGTVEDVMQQANNMDAELTKKKMVVASNTTTTTDCAKVEEEGFSLQQTDIHTIVTVTDKIKMELMKAGVDVSYFGDSLSAEQLEAFTGNTVLAQQLAGRIQQLQLDIPLTADNVGDCKEALQEIAELQELNDGALKYMLDNQLEPTIANLYKAQYSGSAVYTNQADRKFPLSGMSDQISKIIAQSGRTEEEAWDDSEWLLQNEIPLTAGNLNYLKELKSIEFPQNTEHVMDEMVTAISEGKRPQDAVLIDHYSLAGQAANAAEVIQSATEEDIAYVVIQGQAVTVENLEKAHNQIQVGALSAAEKEDVANLVQSAAEAVLDVSSDISMEDAIKAEQKADHVAQVTGAGVSVEQAAQTTGVYESYTEIEITFIIARRQLEEVRMSMTIEASYFMLKQGISIDTASMEELIGHLKNIENQYYQNLLKEGGIEATQANVSLFAETSDKLEQLKNMPAYALGVRNIGVATLEELHQEGSAMQQNFEQANERYETMQTQVRKDLGDSIQKAFQNVDDILKDLGQEITPANERAVRILGYNQIEITPENVARMKVADQQVQIAFHNLTPAVIREFIGRGVNPLDLDIKELNKQAEQIQSELELETPEEKYSEYLYKLEKNNDISQEERSSYIGIYRLMNHIVESDGAAVGALIHQGAQITMRNLLAAVRSERHSGMDISIDESFGELESGGYIDSITDQIEAGYQHQCVKQAFQEISPERLRLVTNVAEWEDLTPEQFLQKIQEAPEDLEAEESYYRQQLDDLVKCAKSSQEVYQVLEQYDIPNTMLNVMAVSEYMNHRNNAFRRLFQSGNGRKPDAEISADEYMTKKEDGSVEVDFEAMKTQLLERFGEEIKKPKELAKAMAELAECAEKCMSTMIMEPDVTSLDIRGLKLMNAQISIGAKMASSECFSMPIVVDGEVTNVTLKIVRDKQQKGFVNITMQTDRFGKIAAEFKANEKGFTGYIASDTKKTRDLLKSMDEDFTQALSEVQDGTVQISYMMSRSLDLNFIEGKSGAGEEPESEELREVQTKILYGAAENFIKVIKKMDAA